jgi:hypothetical protein
VRSETRANYQQASHDRDGSMVAFDALSRVGVRLGRRNRGIALFG